jgi:hypothetical protein
MCTLWHLLNLCCAKPSCSWHLVFLLRCVAMCCDVLWCVFDIFCNIVSVLNALWFHFAPYQTVSSCIAGIYMSCTMLLHSYCTCTLRRFPLLVYFFPHLTVLPTWHTYQPWCNRVWQGFVIQHIEAGHCRTAIHWRNWRWHERHRNTSHHKDSKC